MIPRNLEAIISQITSIQPLKTCYQWACFLTDLMWGSKEKIMCLRSFLTISHIFLTAKECGGVLTDQQKLIQSPGFPDEYQDGQICYWHIRARLGQRIHLHFLEFDVEDDTSCLADYLEVYDSYDDVSGFAGRWGSPFFITAAVRANSRVLRVTLRTDLLAFLVVHCCNSLPYTEVFSSLNHCILHTGGYFHEYWLNLLHLFLFNLSPGSVAIIYLMTSSVQVSVPLNST